MIPADCRILPRGYGVHHIELQGEVIGTVYPGSQPLQWSAQGLSAGVRIEVLNRPSIDAAAGVYCLLVETAKQAVVNDKRF